MAGVGTVLSLSMATSASAAVTGLDIGSVSKGAMGAVTVPITFTCDPGAVYVAFVGVGQIARDGSDHQGDNNFAEGSCTGEPQTVISSVSPYDPKFKFKKGTAWAYASVASYCYEAVPENFCGSADVSEDIQIT
jgi:hypothetical protein